VIAPEALQGGLQLDRRALLSWAGGLAAGALLAGRRAEAASETPGGTRPATAGGLDARGVELYMKLHASAADGEVPWYYTGRIYAIRERQAPVHLFNLEGTEIYWVRRVGADEWRTTSSTLTFYRDGATGEYLESYANPLNGRTLPLYPNVLRTAPGKYSSFSPRGQDAAGGGTSPWIVETHRSAGTLWLTTSRALPSAPQPWMEVQTIFGAEAEFDDPRVARPAATFSSSYSAPYLKWMEMGDLPGHLLWHSSGRKLASVSEVPAAYRARAERLQPGHFVAPAAVRA
jgi:hypothetical protein